MKSKIKIEETHQLLLGDKVFDEKSSTSVPPETVDVSRPSISDLNAEPSVKAKSCIYCGEKNDLTREHAAPFALGGTLTIISGSCPRCQEITKDFETDVLKHQLRMVRYIQGMPSRSKHKNVPREVMVTIVRNGGNEEEVILPIEEAPILIPFLEFGLPMYFDKEDPQLKVIAFTTGSFGRHPHDVVKAMGSGKLTIIPPNIRPVSFARMIAKIAYCQAYALGTLDLVEDISPLVNAFMYEPDKIGRFVGSKPQPFERHKNLTLRIATKKNEVMGILYVEVQLFASTGAPTYVVVLGQLKTAPNRILKHTLTNKSGNIS